MQHTCNTRILKKKFNNAFSKHCERNFGRAIADVFCKEDGILWFFNECIIHGHDPEICPITSRKKQKSCFGQSFKSLNQEFEKKLLSLDGLFNQINVVWQCEWKREKKNNKDLIDFLQRSYVPWPSHHISPREAVRGARIETFGLKWTDQLNPNENLFYVDYSSLYPYVRWADFLTLKSYCQLFVLSMLEDSD